MDPCIAHSRKPQVKTLGESRWAGARDQLRLRIRGIEFAQTASPIRIEVGRSRVSTAVNPELVERHLEGLRHVAVINY
jgi:hypothetical protein